MEFQDLRKNIWLKILSLIFAVLLWSYVSFVQNPLSEVFAKVDIYNIELNNVPKDAIVLNMPDKVTVKIKGPPKAINNIKPDEFKAYVDLSGKQISEDFVNVKINVNPPVSVDIVEINPPVARVRMEISSPRVDIENR